MDSFRAQVEEELKEDWAQDYDPRHELLFIDEEEADAPELPSNLEPRGSDDSSFQAWKSTNVMAQDQPGYNFVSVTVPLGDLSPEQFRGLADISRKHASSRVRMTPEQNLMMRWVPDAYLYDFYQDLQGLGLADGGLDEISDTTSCPGTDSCKLGITSSMGLNKALGDAIKNPNGESSLLEDPLIKQMHVKMSGCPNGCGRHHVADIGFHGAFIKGPGGGQIPAYEVFVGGSYENADVRYGIRPRGKIPAKRVPEAVFTLLRFYKENRQEGEYFKDFSARLGREPFEEVITGLGDVERLTKDTLDLYMDYDKDALYIMERGEGECAT
jgi:sulfite reductase beta subunit-like hemoprotein